MFELSPANIQYQTSRRSQVEGKHGAHVVWPSALSEFLEQDIVWLSPSTARHQYPVFHFSVTRFFLVRTRLQMFD